MVRPMVHSQKHIVQYSIFTATGGVATNKAIVTAVAVGNKNLPEEVEEGSTIKAVYLELWARSSSATPGSGQMIVYKRGGDTTFASGVDMAQLHDWDNKKNILYTTQGLINDNDADAINLIKGWIKIPKGKQRFGLGDKLAFTVFDLTVDVVNCGVAIFKEYS